MPDLDWNEADREHCNVVFLAESLGGIGNLFGGLCRNYGSTLKSEELTSSILRFHDSVGDKSESGTWS